MARGRYRSIAFPLIGPGTGGSREEKVLGWMLDELGRIEFEGTVVVVRFRRQRG